MPHTPRHSSSPTSKSSSPAPSLPHVFLDIAVDQILIGRIVLCLRSDVAKRTAENFRLLCTGERGMGAAGSPLHFKGCVWHRIIRNFMAASGDITNGNGVGGEAAVCRSGRFADETFELSHSKPGVLSMAGTSGPNSNGSQFFITLRAQPHLDGKHVAFGHVVEGMGVLRAMELCGKSSSCATRRTVTIANCGQVV